MLSLAGVETEYDREQKTEMAAWQPQNNSEIQRVTRDALVSTFGRSLERKAQQFIDSQLMLINIPIDSRAYSRAKFDRSEGCSLVSRKHAGEC